MDAVDSVATLEHEPRTRSRREVLVGFAAIQLAMLLAALDQTAVATALPRIVGDLHGFEHLSWIVTAYIVASTVTIPLYGKLSDQYGRRTLLVFSIVVFVAGSALCGTATSMTELILFRVLQGLGAGGLIPLSQAAVADLFSPRERGRYQGYLGAVWAGAAIAGPLLGGTLTDAASWRWIFFINLPLGILALLVVVRTMAAHTPLHHHRLDFPGAALLSAGVTGLLLASVWTGTTYAWDSAPILATGGGGLVLLVLFVLQERRAPEPLVSLHLFRIRTMAVASSAQLINGAMLFALTIYVPVYLQGVLGASATESGAVLIPFSLSWTIASAGSGQVVSRTGRYRVFPITGSVLVVLGFLLLTRLDSDTSRLEVAGILVIIGVGLGLMSQIYITAAQNAVAASDIGIVTATTQFLRTMGGSLAVALVGAVLSYRLGVELAERLGPEASRVDPNALLHGGGHIAPRLLEASREPLAAAIHTALLGGIPLALVGVLIALNLQELPLRRA